MGGKERGPQEGQVGGVLFRLGQTLKSSPELHGKDVHCSMFFKENLPSKLYVSTQRTGELHSSSPVGGAFQTDRCEI